ncbi:MAG: hypothetical protein ACON4T_09190 [Synechococcus sp.]
MRSTLLFFIGLNVIAPAGAQAKPMDLPFPSREALRDIQLQAYACSRTNTAASCDQTRSLTDPLMDHPLLSAACKNTLWDLLQNANAVSSNSFQRRDSIDRPARRMAWVCAKPVKPAETNGPRGNPSTGSPRP